MPEDQLTLSEAKRTQIFSDYERLALAGHKRLIELDGRPVLQPADSAALSRLIAIGFAAREDSVFVLRSVRDVEIFQSRHLPFFATGAKPPG